MSDSTSNSWLHRYAVLTAAVALLPIGMGALVTTLDAGMAFLDWPTSDGQNMFLYPWLKDFAASKDKFVEHGHRLAGSLIGMFSIGLAALAWKREPRAWVRGLAIGILAAVILQGLLGGFRVITDARVAALVHGLFASLIFATITVFALVTGKNWFSVQSVVRTPLFEQNDSGERSASPEVGVRTTERLVIGRLKTLKLVAIATPVLIFGQSLVGGVVRHFGSQLHEHLGGAILTTICVVAAIGTAWRTRHAWLRSASWMLLFALLIQLTLGAGAWVTRFGFPMTGYVAVQQAPEQILFRTAHTVAAMFVLMASVQLAVRVLRLEWLSRGTRCQLAHGGLAGALEAYPTGLVGTLETCPTAGGAMP